MEGVNGGPVVVMESSDHHDHVSVLPNQVLPTHVSVLPPAVSVRPTARPSYCLTTRDPLLHQFAKQRDAWAIALATCAPDPWDRGRRVHLGARVHLFFWRHENDSLVCGRVSGWECGEWKGLTVALL